jgi:sulfur relay (sulfurtransferase) complex TusBCD TusD component (DsrE family)
VRIGDGNIDVALKIAEALADEFDKQIHIEIVNEAGTTALAKSKPNKRYVKDLRAARLIALRQGRELTPSLIKSYGK